MIVAYDFAALRRDYPLAKVAGDAGVKLRRSSRNLIGCCPFHPDRSPSFVVWPDQHFHCFGCGASGDVIDFVGKSRNLRAPEAIAFLTGGEVPTLTDEDRKQLDRERAESEQRRAAHEAAAKLEAAKRWNEAQPINGVPNAYLERKCVAPYGARQEGDWLLLPIYDAQGVITSVQTVSPMAGGPKFFHAGAPVSGGRMYLGEETQNVFVCEGFATGASIHMALDGAAQVVVAFSKSNVAAIARELVGKRRVIIAADTNAEEEMCRLGKEISASVVLPDLQGADGTDFNDQHAHYGLEDVAATLNAVLTAPVELALQVTHPADWQGTTAPEREWAVDGFIPQRQAALLTGAGAAGKSLLSQLLCTCMGTGEAFVGVPVASARALYITCEDDLDELHRRQQAICEGLGIPLEQTRDRVFLVSLYGELGNELCTYDEKRTLHVAERFRQIEQTALALQVGFIVLDNTSHFYTGNENVRPEVAAFVNLCNSLARTINGAVVMVGFPNKAGDSYSGSTAWENQVRARLFLETPKNEDGQVIDADYRVLRNEKANYARKGAEVGLIWNAGTFKLPPTEGEEAAITHQFTSDQALEALREIDRRWHIKQPFSAAHNSPDRYLGSWLQHRFKMSGRAASNQIKSWAAAGFIVSEEVDRHSKKHGLRVQNWPN